MHCFEKVAYLEELGDELKTAALSKAPLSKMKTMRVRRATEPILKRKQKQYMGMYDKLTAAAKAKDLGKYRRLQAQKKKLWHQTHNPSNRSIAYDNAYSERFK